jgi:hypothetical protein
MAKGVKMEVSKATIELLAKAWLAEAKRLHSNPLCDCGCKQTIPVTRFRPGHDAKLLREYKAQIKKILAGAK